MNKIGQLNLTQAFVLEDRPTSINNIYLRVELQKKGLQVFRTLEDQPRWFWLRKEQEKEVVSRPGVDFSESLFDSEWAALKDAKLTVKAYSMPFSTWEKLTDQQQQDYLHRHHLEQRGYTLTGSSSMLSDVEFCDAVPVIEMRLG